jgi:two-component system, OmpR family, phosphate regulon sensor histidine kinase PhoR
MSAIAIAVTVGLLAFMAMAVRIISEQAARLRAEQRAQELERRARELELMLERASDHEREWLAVLAHEMRSSIAAILGYGELLGDGALGELPERGVDAVSRMNRAAEHILRLVHGVEELALPGLVHEGEPERLSARELLAEAAASLGFDAEARGSSITIDHGDIELCTRRADALRGLLLALSAAIKVSAGSAIRLAATVEDDRPRLIIAGTRLDVDTDDPARANGSVPLTGAGFRIALARSAIAAVDGALALHDHANGAELHLELPRLDP